ncbi:MAG: OsmC family protein [Deltaproteobacteria bacterium]|nr:OsmC family protein [Deltaproteobacteria bacterium]MCH7914056.1 OsmC family protein [Deltaproteobacteria bacterium]MCZ6546574.1 OsmC family protein [Deltaproteobacteria bacterium]
MLTQVARFAHLYDVPIEDGEVDVRCTFDVADKMGLEGSGAAFESVSFAVSIKSSAPEEQVRKLIVHAERGCHASQTFRKPIPVTTTATLNGKKLDV